MFGFKIISENEYRKMKSLAEQQTNFHMFTDGKIKGLENDCESLREQLNEKIMKLQHLGKLNNLYVLKSEEYPCDKCKGETDKCLKLTFANQTICVVEKKYVNDFSKKTTAKRSKK